MEKAKGIFMDENETMQATVLDTMVSNKQLQILKAAIPYISVQEQKYLSIFAKFEELVNTFSLFQSNSKEDSVGICGFSEDSNQTIDMLNAIKGYCSAEEQDTLDLMLNFMTAFSLSESL